VTRIFRFRFPNPHFPNRIRFPLTNIEMEIEMEFFRTFPSVFIARAGRPADGSAWRKERQDTMMRRIDAVADQSRAAASFFAAAAAAAAASGWAAGGQPRSWHSSAWPRSTCTGRRLSVSSLAPKADRRGGPGRPGSSESATVHTAGAEGTVNHASSVHVLLQRHAWHGMTHPITHGPLYCTTRVNRYKPCRRERDGPPLSPRVLHYTCTLCYVLPCL
jgi:hypothetical protein